MKNSQNLVSQDHDSFFDDNFVDDHVGKLCRIHSFSLCYLDNKDENDLEECFVPPEDIMGVILKTEGSSFQILSIGNSQKIWANMDDVFLMKETQ